MTQFDLDAGHLALDYANTADWHASEEPVEELTSYEALIDWGEQAEVISAEEGELLRAAAGDRDLARAALDRAVQLRELVYRVFTAIAHEAAPAADDLATLRDWFVQAAYHGQLRMHAGGYDWRWRTDQPDPDRVLWPVAYAATRLLLSDELERVGQCADDRGCGWLFYDRSRNKSRRWCSMESCGNRAKAMRHYERVKGDDGA